MKSMQRPFQFFALLLSFILVAGPSLAAGSKATSADAAAKAEPKKAEPKKAEPKKAEPTKAEPKKATKAKPKPSKLQPKSIGSDGPWAKGVSLQDQRTAQRLVDEGNALLKESFFSKAEDKYRESLERWDHPGTHYNLALALLTKDEPIETHEHFSKSIEYGPEPLEQDKYDNAQKYLGLLEKQIARVEISCQESGAQVRLDGALLFVGPGRYEGMVVRGAHSVTAAKPGYETTQIDRSMEPDEPTILELRVFRPEDLYVHERKYPMWIPIVVTASGVAIAGAGGLFTYLSQNEYDKFDDDLVDDPSCELGCEPGDDINQHKSQGDMYKLMGTVGLAAGGATVAAGITLWALNKKSTHKVTPEEMQRISFVPIVSPKSVGLIGTARF